jgi:hypothetical protein
MEPIDTYTPASKKERVPFLLGSNDKGYRILKKSFIIGLDINKKTEKPNWQDHWKLSGMAIEEDDKIYFSCIYYPLFLVLNPHSLSLL